MGVYELSIVLSAALLLVQVPTAELCVFEEIPVGRYDVSPGAQWAGLSLKDCLTQCFNDQSCTLVLYYARYGKTDVCQSFVDNGGWFDMSNIAGKTGRLYRIHRDIERSDCPKLSSLQ